MALTSAPVRVLLGARVGFVRAGLRALLEESSDITVAGVAGNSDEVLAEARATRPDVVILDIDLPGLDAIETTRRIVTDRPVAGIRILILGEQADANELFSVLQAGATGFLLKQAGPVELAGAVRVVADGGAQFSPSIALRMVERFTSTWSPTREIPARLDELTARQREVMVLVAAGLTNREIAERLVISTATSKTHVSRTMMKLGVRTRSELVTLAYEAGLVRARLDVTDRAEARSLSG